MQSEVFYVKEKFQFHNLGSNQRPSDLLHNILTTVLPHVQGFYSDIFLLLKSPSSGSKVIAENDYSQ